MYFEKNVDIKGSKVKLSCIVMRADDTGVPLETGNIYVHWWEMGGPLKSEATIKDDSFKDVAKCVAEFMREIASTNKLDMVKVCTQCALKKHADAYWKNIQLSIPEGYLPHRETTVHNASNVAYKRKA